MGCVGKERKEMDNECQLILYRFLGQAFTYPDAGFAARLRNLLGETHLSTWEGGELPLAPLVREIKSLDELPLAQLQGEHTRLFISNHPHVPCPPYESAYREGALLGHATEATYNFYRRWGLEMSKEMADHVGAELEFMAFLSGLPPDEETTAAQRTFLRDHLLAWLPRFAADLEQHAHLNFYRALARLLIAFLAQEKKHLLDETTGAVA